MAIEQDIKRIADSLETLVNMYKAATPEAKDVVVTVKQEEIVVAPPKPVSDKKPAKTSKRAEVAESLEVVVDTPPTLDDLTDALRSAIGTSGPQKVKELIEKYNASKLSQIKESDYSALLKDLKKLIG